MDRDTLDQFIIEKARAHGLTVITGWGHQGII
jgi:hypothetical protein